MNHISPKIAILITTFERDELLYKSVQSLVENFFENCMILVADQGTPSNEKAKWVLETKTRLDNQFHYRELPYNCGLSAGRNFLVRLAKEKGCDYCLLSSDSFLYNESLQNLNNIVKNYLWGYNLIGFDLKGSVCGWEAKLKLIEGQAFELDFIEKTNRTARKFYIDMKSNKEINIWDIDICRNIFMASAESLLETQWDEKLKLAEHESFFHEYQKAGFKCGWTNYIIAEKMKDRPIEYNKFRQRNFDEGRQYLKEKYDIKGWVIYKHLERAKNNG